SPQHHDDNRPFTHHATIHIYNLSLHHALPIFLLPTRPHHHRKEDDHNPDGPADVAVAEIDFHRTVPEPFSQQVADKMPRRDRARSEEHTSELQSRFDLVCRLLLEKKKRKTINL